MLQNLLLKTIIRHRNTISLALKRGPYMIRNVSILTYFSFEIGDLQRYFQHDLGHPPKPQSTCTCNPSIAYKRTKKLNT